MLSPQQNLSSPSASNPSAPIQAKSNAPSFEKLEGFPDQFIWGVATAAFQIEGGHDQDGKGESVWDRFCRKPGTIADSSNGDIACDHYNRLESDLDLIASFGVDAYRFSVSWPRVQPDGSGAWNQKGFDFYERLINGLITRGIAPYLTLNHWDLPQALQEKGGWANRATVDFFVAYALEISRRFGDRLAAITTHNEPWVVAFLGHEAGIFAPGIKDQAIAQQVAHHLLLSHGKSIKAMRQAGCKAKLGIVLNLSPFMPASDSPEDRSATKLEEGRLVRWYMDALMFGRYPEDVLTALGANSPIVMPNDMELIAQPMDYLGVNYYTRAVVRAGTPFDVKTSGLPLTDMGWEVYPDGLTQLLLQLHRDYPVPPIYITENGAAFKDTLNDGRVNDHERVQYLATHIAAVRDAIVQGVPVVGYMVWSMFDNFEWASGYAKRFGLVYVDYTTQQRHLKESAIWFKRFVSNNKVQVKEKASA